MPLIRLKFINVLQRYEQTEHADQLEEELIDRLVQLTEPVKK